MFAGIIKSYLISKHFRENEVERYNEKLDINKAHV